MSKNPSISVTRKLRRMLLIEIVSFMAITLALVGSLTFFSATWLIQRQAEERHQLISDLAITNASRRLDTLLDSISRESNLQGLQSALRVFPAVRNAMLVRRTGETEVLLGTLLPLHDWPAANLKRGFEGRTFAMPQSARRAGIVIAQPSAPNSAKERNQVVLIDIDLEALVVESINATGVPARAELASMQGRVIPTQLVEGVKWRTSERAMLIPVAMAELSPMIRVATVRDETDGIIVILWFFAAAYVAVLLLSWRIASNRTRRLAAPIEALTDAVKLLAETGELRQKLSQSGSVEIVSLVRSINAIADKMTEGEEKFSLDFTKRK